MLNIQIFLVIVATIVLVFFAERQKLRKITWILIIGCIGYLILIITPEIPDKEYEANELIDSPKTNGKNNPELKMAKINIQSDTVITSKIDKVTILNKIKANATADTNNKIIDENKSLRINSVVMAKNIVDREPEGVSRLFLNDIDHLYCYTSVNNPISNNKIIHHWYSNNIEYFNFAIEIDQSDNWRCWSKITINPHLAGEWEVSVSDTLGNILGNVEFAILPTEE